MMVAPRERLRSIVIDLLATAGIALGLFAPFVGLVTKEGANALIVGWRPVALAIVVAGCVLLRLAVLLRGVRVSPGQLLGPLLLVFGLTLPFWANRYYIDLGVLVLTYIMLAWGLNIVVGLAGLLDLGYVAFYAVGAYTYAIFSTTLGLGFWVSLPIAALFAAIWGICLGFPVLRLKGDYLAIVTLAFGEIIRIVILNWVSLTNGPNGISGIPRPTLFGLKFNMSGDADTFAGYFGLEPSLTQRLVYLYYIILGLALFTSFVTMRLRRSPLGRAWEALREDEIACRALGINVTITKLTAFAIGASFGGLAGAFFATRQAFISPESFTFIESAIVLAIVVLGGLGSQFGTALAAIVMIGGLEVLRDMLSNFASANANTFLSSVASQLPQYRMLLFGIALIVVMVVKPRGLVSGRVATIALAGRRKIPETLVSEAQHVH